MAPAVCKIASRRVACLCRLLSIEPVENLKWLLRRKVIEPLQRSVEDSRVKGASKATPAVFFSLLPDGAPCLMSGTLIALFRKFLFMSATFLNSWRVQGLICGYDCHGGAEVCAAQGIFIFNHMHGPLFLCPGISNYEINLQQAGCYAPIPSN